MEKIRIWLAVMVFFSGVFTPVCVYAQKKNPLQTWKQSSRAVAGLERKMLEALKVSHLPAGADLFPRNINAVLRAAEQASRIRLTVPRGGNISGPRLPVLATVGAGAPSAGEAVSFPGKETVDAVIFDLDGTLLDSLSAWENSGTNFVRSQGLTPPEGLQETLVKMSLMDGARLIKEMFSLPQTPEEILRLTLEPIRRHYFEDIPAKPGVPETLRLLKAQGVRLCIATASDEELTRAALARLGLLDLFDFVVTCDEVGAGKRDPAVYEEALRRLGTEKSRTLVVEDAPYALQTAHRAGFMIMGVADSHTKPEGACQMRLQADFYVEDYLHGVFRKK